MYKTGWIVNGPNLNMLGFRSKEHYGSETYSQLMDSLINYGKSLNLELQAFQSNHEGEIIDKLHTLVKEKCDFIILNMGALSHYSIAIYDALEMVKVPMIEVHLSNIYAREEFRKTSLFTKLCIGQITGFKERSYYLAIDYLAQLEEK